MRSAGRSRYEPSDRLRTSPLVRPRAQIAQLGDLCLTKLTKLTKLTSTLKINAELAPWPGQKPTTPRSKLTSGRHAGRFGGGIGAMTAAPLIEAVRRAGGAITCGATASATVALRRRCRTRWSPRLRQHKAEILDVCSTAATARGAEAAAWRSQTHGTGQPSVERWRRRCRAPPRDVTASTLPGRAWQQLLADAERFLDGWAAGGTARLAGLGAVRLSPARALGRIQGMGLVLLLRGDEIAALTATEAVIRTRTRVPVRPTAQATRPAASC